MKRLPVSAMILFLIVGVTFFAGQWDQRICQLNPDSLSCHQADGGAGGNGDAICPGSNNGGGYAGGCTTTAPRGGVPGPTPTPNWQINLGAASPYSGAVPAAIQTATGYSTWDQMISSGQQVLQVATATGANSATVQHEGASMVVTLPDGTQVTLRSGPRVSLKPIAPPATPTAAATETPTP